MPAAKAVLNASLKQGVLGAILMLPFGLSLAEASADQPTTQGYAEVCECVDPYNGVRNIPVVIRDFHDTHPDFQSYLGTDRGIVEAELGADGRPVYAHPEGSTLTTTGKTYFDQWYRDVPGVNQGVSKTLQMIEIDPASGEPTPGTGFWDYRNNAFFPIDDEVFGNDGRQHNYHFTLETHLKFFYVEGGEFTFRGDDDLWIFINGKLAIDIGGVHPMQQQTIYLDDIADYLDIEPGNTYNFDLFFAERHTTESNFMFQTTLELQCL